MINTMRQATLETLGLGTVLEIFQNGKMPAEAGNLVDKVFGNAGERGAMVVSGSKGIVGAGKMMQLGVRLMDYGVPLVGLDMGGAPDGISFQYDGLVQAFGREKADEILSNIIQLNYNGKSLPPHLKAFNPKFLLEAIPEILEIKKSHYKMFRESFPDIQISSVTSGFPMSELGVRIAHPAFPHQINKIWEIVEEEPSDITKLFWALGMIPMEVSDNWSFVLDVQFCGLMLSGLRYNEATNMPFWKLDKYIRKLLGPNPFRAHDVIGAAGANFLTWSCLNDLSKNYGSLYTPTDSLVEHKDGGSNWYPLNHLRPMVNWSLEGDEYNDFKTRILGSMFQMTSLLLHENRSHLTCINSIGELCAQFRQGLLSTIRSFGSDAAINLVEGYHKLHPEAANSSWHPDTFAKIDTPEWQQLYVNAEHDGKVGVITIARESYNHEVNTEMNRAIDWLKSANIDRVILTGDFHLTTQLVGADTSEFYPALKDVKEGFAIAFEWSKTARRFNDEFKSSVAFINGKRCLGGMLELFLHCHYVVSIDDAKLGAPEVNLPVVPGMELCHWSIRKAKSDDRIKIMQMLLSGRDFKAKYSVGWLIDYAGTMDDSLQMAWKLANEDEQVLPKRKLEEDIFELPREVGGLSKTDNPAIIAARKAIFDSMRSSCRTTIEYANEIQAKHSAEFMLSKECQRGFVGSDYKKTMEV